MIGCVFSAGFIHLCLFYLKVCAVVTLSFSWPLSRASAVFRPVNNSFQLNLNIRKVCSPTTMTVFDPLNVNCQSLCCVQKNRLIPIKYMNEYDVHHSHGFNSTFKLYSSVALGEMTPPPTKTTTTLSAYICFFQDTQ